MELNSVAPKRRALSMKVLAENPGSNTRLARAATEPRRVLDAEVATESRCSSSATQAGQAELCTASGGARRGGPQQPCVRLVAARHVATPGRSSPHRRATTRRGEMFAPGQAPAWRSERIASATSARHASPHRLTTRWGFLRRERIVGEIAVQQSVIRSDRSRDSASVRPVPPPRHRRSLIHPSTNDGIDRSLAT